MKKHIPEETVARLPVYHRYLQSLTKQGVKNISSKKLATLLKINDSQVRKDLSYFGKFGRQGSGYDVIKLRDSIENILDIKKEFNLDHLGFELKEKTLEVHGGLGDFLRTLILTLPG